MPLVPDEPRQALVQQQRQHEVVLAVVVQALVQQQRQHEVVLAVVVQALVQQRQHEVVVGYHHADDQRFWYDEECR